MKCSKNTAIGCVPKLTEDNQKTEENAEIELVNPLPTLIEDVEPVNPALNMDEHNEPVPPKEEAKIEPAPVVDTPEDEKPKTAAPPPAEDTSSV